MHRQVVHLRLGDQHTLAQIVRLRDPDTADLRAFSVYEDGRFEVLELFGSRRGIEDGQWQELPPMAELPVEQAAEPIPPPPPAEARSGVAVVPPRMPTIIMVRT